MSNKEALLERYLQRIHALESRSRDDEQAILIGSNIVKVLSENDLTQRVPKDLLDVVESFASRIATIRPGGKPLTAERHILYISRLENRRPDSLFSAREGFNLTACIRKHKTDVLIPKEYLDVLVPLHEKHSEVLKQRRRKHERVTFATPIEEDRAPLDDLANADVLGEYLLDHIDDAL